MSGEGGTVTLYCGWIASFESLDVMVQAGNAETTDSHAQSVWQHSLNLLLVIAIIKAQDQLYIPALP